MDRMKEGYYWVYDPENEAWEVWFYDAHEHELHLWGTPEPKKPEWLIGKSIIGPLQVPRVVLCTDSMVTM